MRTLIFLALLPLAGCPLFSVEGEVPEVCMNFHDRMIAGVPRGQTFEKTLTSDPIDALGRFVELNADITDARATLQARSGVGDLKFLESVSVVMRSAESMGARSSISLVDCADYACASDQMTSTLTEQAPEGIMDVVKAGKVAIDITLGGDLPENDWVVDLEVCVSGKASAAVNL